MYTDWFYRKENQSSQKLNKGQMLTELITDGGKAGVAGALCNGRSSCCCFSMVGTRLRKPPTQPQAAQ